MIGSVFRTRDYSRTKQLVSNFEAEIGGKPKQPKAELKNGVAYKKA